VPYEKGFAFLVFLERAAGGAEAFAPFIKARWDAFAHAHAPAHHLRR
jgi:hypothetical protein